MTAMTLKALRRLEAELLEDAVDEIPVLRGLRLVRHAAHVAEEVHEEHVGRTPSLDQPSEDPLRDIYGK